MSPVLLSHPSCERRVTRVNPTRTAADGKTRGKNENEKRGKRRRRAGGGGGRREEEEGTLREVRPRFRDPPSAHTPGTVTQPL